MSNEILKNDTSIALDWADVAGADLYHCQVSLTPDFAPTLVDEDNALATSAFSFTDGGANNAKRYWRWRYSTDSGTTWSEWSEVGSYWLNTGFIADVSLANNAWALVDPDAVTDIYTLPVAPFYSLTRQRIQRSRERNRLGTLISDYITFKDMIVFDYSQNGFISHENFRAILRFSTEIKTFFILTKKNNGVDQVPMVWKVEFAEDPQLTMLAMGRQDLLVGQVSMEEV